MLAKGQDANHMKWYENNKKQQKKCASASVERQENLQITSDSSIISPLEQLSMSSDDWSQAATLAWLLQFKGKAAADCAADCLRTDMHCKSKENHRSTQYHLLLGFVLQW